MPLKMTKFLFSTLTCCLILLLIFTSCNQDGKQAVETDKTDTSKSINSITSPDKEPTDSSPFLNNLDKKIIDTIYSLKEVKDRQSYIERQTKNSRHLQIWIEDTPNQTNKYYWVKAGEDNGTNLV